ncbi:hypothetical protein [Rheinheimera mangrovi]|uniref:hypothetical protein n=1 Tax=Rheinheimera mangrovi TaxID=2498451 RepID=UPI000F8EE9F5|nr:hypothetical protein [Rheinheimera mangrovi]
MEKVCSQIISFLMGRPAYIEIIVGPRIQARLELDEFTHAFPLVPTGNSLHVDFGCQLLNFLGIPFDDGFVQMAINQGSPFNDATAVVYSNLSSEDFELAGQGLLKKVGRYRALLALYAGGPFSPIVKMKWNEPGLAHVEFQAPPYRRGLISRLEDDPISSDFLRLCAGERNDDDQLHYYISLLQQASELADEHFRIARMYSLLETMASGISSQFERRAKKPMTRAAIRFMTGYFIDFDIPRFTLGKSDDYEFDHIELAGQVRHKIFHGGGQLKTSDVSAKLKPGVELLNRRPDLIANVLRRDCESQLTGWARRTSRAWQAQNGIEFELPSRDPNYDGRTLTKCLISSPEPAGSSIGSVNVRVKGMDIGSVRLEMVNNAWS